MKRSSVLTASTASRRSKKANPNNKKIISHADVDDENDDDVSYEISQSVYKARFEALQQRLHELSEKTIEQQKHITELSTQMSLVVSWFEQCSTPEQYSVAFMDFAAAVERPAIAVTDRTVHDKIIAAVYVDNERRNNRATNFIVSGLKPSHIRPDPQSIIDLCRTEFGETIDVVHCKQLGKQVTCRIQPLLVSLKTAAQSARIISTAKNLRNSSDTSIRQSTSQLI